MSTDEMVCPFDGSASVAQPTQKGSERGYTVVLLYPDYMQEQGADSFIDCADAPTAREAVEKVREMAKAANVDSVEDADDFALIAVFHGHVVLAGEESLV